MEHAQSEYQHFEAHSMYGNVDAALRWQKDFSKYLVEECGMEICRTDPCMLVLRVG